MSELWWCTVCQRETRFSTFETNGFSWLCCRRCGGGICTTPETPTEEAS